MNNICRICESIEIYVDLTENSNTAIVSKLQAFSEIKVSSSVTLLPFPFFLTFFFHLQFDPVDCLPKYICKKCLISLNFAYKFKIQCEYTDHKLRRILNVTGVHVKSADDIQRSHENKSKNPTVARKTVVTTSVIKQDKFRILSDHANYTKKYEEEPNLQKNHTNAETNIIEIDMDEVEVTSRTVLDKTPEVRFKGNY